MHRLLAWVSGAFLMLLCAMGGTAFAVPSGAAGSIRAASAALDPVEKTQYYVDDYYWDGYFWCWYEFGWHGPGWYVCDYGPWVTGYWWGGGFGWHHWRWHGPRLHGAYHHHGKQNPAISKFVKTPPGMKMKVSKGGKQPTGTMKVSKGGKQPTGTMKVSKGGKPTGTMKVSKGGTPPKGAYKGSTQ